ncbi:NAD(P)-binding domain-containing protein [Nocardioides sp. NPDC006303]|uniref:lactate/malate family dehydrogenase n=1 Tax=Nocardioides sp. NPDC006303 TaxID=3156747 RepID=UPI0033A1E49E
MNVVGEEVVRAAYRRGQRKVVAEPTDIVTPQALDAVDRLGMRLLRAPTTKAPPLSTEPGRALSRTLYRRHPGFVPAGRRTNVRAVRFDKIAIIGAGGMGSALAGLLASEGACDRVKIVDLIPGLAASVAEDLRQAAPLIGKSTDVVSGTDRADIAGADVVVVAPEAACLPGMTEVLLGEVQLAAESIASHAPDAVVIFGGWPSEVFTEQLRRSGNLAPEKVIGTGATLASVRLVNALAAHAGVAREEVEAVALGADGAYVPLLSSARVRGRAVGDVLRPSELEAALADARVAADHVQSLRSTRPPAIAPAHAALEIVNALRGARPGPVPASVWLDDQYGVEDTVLGVNATLNQHGLKSVVEVPLSADERTAVQAAANGVRRGLQALAELQV